MIRGEGGGGVTDEQEGEPFVGRDHKSSTRNRENGPRFTVWKGWQVDAQGKPNCNDGGGGH